MASEAVAKSAPYPAKTRTATGTVNGIPTEAEVTYFKDKIMVLVSQSGRLAQWVCERNSIHAGVLLTASLTGTDPSPIVGTLRCVVGCRPHAWNPWSQLVH